MTESLTPGVLVVDIAKLHTTFAKLRSNVFQGTDDLKTLPLRVVPFPQVAGHFEVVDGFKRLATAKDLGQTRITVLVEELTIPEAKALVIKANSPSWTLAPLDAARVIQSLVEEEGFSHARIGRLLGRDRSWVCKRGALIEKLDPSLHQMVDTNKLPFSLAYSLLPFPRAEQKRLTRSILAAGLSSSDGQAFVATYRALESEGEKKALLGDPLGTLDQINRTRCAVNPAQTAVATATLNAMRELASQFDRFVTEKLPVGITPGEARLITAERKRLIAKIQLGADLLGRPEPARPEPAAEEEELVAFTSATAESGQAQREGAGSGHPDRTAAGKDCFPGKQSVTSAGEEYREFDPFIPSRPHLTPPGLDPPDP